MVAVDELFGRLAEKPFEEFTEGERTLWQRLKAAARKLLDKFVRTLKLTSWFELGDNELRYMLWRSKERLERGREDPIDQARDIVKREELGLDDDVRYNMGDAYDPSHGWRRLDYDRITDAKLKIYFNKSEENDGKSKGYRSFAKNRLLSLGFINRSAN